MLPYRLRAPMYGNRQSRQLKEATSTGEDHLTGGGPVQRAIVEDLLVLRPTYQEMLQMQRNEESSNNPRHQDTEQPTTTSTRINGHHWDSGKVFGSFKKEVFESSRVSLLHSLVPPKCDREAYSQLIYASCLSLLRQAFSSPNHSTTVVILEEASYALFMLYTLFQTNPLPRSYETSPLELLPMGIHSTENPKLLYRRSFAPNIRIDRSHYTLLLQLRIMASEQQSQCQVTCMKAHEQRLLSARTDGCNSSSSSWKWACRCGLSQDVLEIIDRILPLLDLCEYTGPVSLEGLAGHSEYPFISSSSTEPSQQPQGEEPARLQLSDLPPPRNDTSKQTYLTDELEGMLTRYQSTLKSIRLPITNTVNNRKSAPTPTPISEVLTPLLSSESQQSWSDTLSHIFHSSQEDVAGMGATTTAERHEAAEATLCRGDGDAHRGTIAAEEAMGTELPPPSVDEAPCLAYELILPDDLDSSAREGLQDMLKLLSKRGRILPTVAEETDAHGNKSVRRAVENIAGDEDDDVSSVGEGGISVATGQGREALQRLIASARTNRGRLPRVATIPKRPVRTEGPIRPHGGGFLDIDMLLEGPNVADNDDGSASDISLRDFEDDVSVGTDGVGRRALENLLSTVAPDNDSASSIEESVPIKTAPVKRRGSTASVKSRSDIGYMGTSRAALDALISGGRERSPGKPRKSNKGSTTAVSTRTRQLKAAPTDGEQSLATSVEQGRTALDVLLSKVRSGKMPPPPTRGGATMKKGVGARAWSQEGDESMVASFERGREDVDALPSGVDAQRPSRSKRQRPKLARTPPAEEAESVATSVGQGRAALDVLLSRNNHEKGSPMSTSGRQKRKASRAEPAHELESISIATSIGQGRAALDALLSKADDRKDPPLTTRGRPKRKATGAEPAAMATSVGHGRAALDARLSKEGDEKESRPSAGGRPKRLASRVSRAKPVDDAGSIATSVGQGTAALDALLSKTVGEKEAPPARGRPYKRAAQVARADPVDDAGSVATSVGHGRAALDALLSKVGDEKDPLPSAGGTGRPKRLGSQVSRAKSVDEAGSVATSVGQGTAALDSLLSKAVAEKGAPPARGRRNNKAAHAARTDPLGEAGSVATSVGQGTTALDALLSKADDRKDPPSSTRGRPKRKVTGAEPASVATSVGHRRAAVDALLSKVGDEKKHPPSARGRPKRKETQAAPAKPADEAGSVATSVGQGTAALDALLSKAVAEKGAPPARGRRNNKAAHAARTDPLGEAGSVATSVGQGTTALDALLSKADDRKDPPSSTRGRPKRKVTGAEPASLATSVGHRKAAVDALLPKVGGEKEPPPSARGRPKRKNTQAAPAKPVDEAGSVATSVGQGTAALDALLSEVGSEKEFRPSARGRPKRKVAQMARTHPAEAGSVATSVGEGTTALNALLTGVDATKETRSSTRARPRRKNAKAVCDDAESVATSVGPGRAALNALLSRVVEDENELPRSTSPSGRPKRKRTKSRKTKP